MWRLQVRHIESIMRMAEAHAKMHLREYVRDDDLDMAIRVMIESFIDSQKYSVQRTLQRKFRKYLVYKKHNNSLLMHVLNQLVAEQQAFQQMRSDIRGRKTGGNSGAVMNYEDDFVEVRMDDLEAKAREYEIHDLSQFYKSKEFRAHNFTIDGRKRVVKHSV